MAMRKAARAPSGCIKTRNLPCYQPEFRSAWPLYCSLPCLSQCWSQAARHHFRLLAEILETFRVAAAT